MIDDAFGEFIFLLAQKKNPRVPLRSSGQAKKGTLPPAKAGLRKGSESQRTTTFTIDSLMHYDYSLSLRVQLV
jgi:hypothetical protein